MKNILAYILAVFLSIARGVFADDSRITLEPVIVTSSRIESGSDNARIVTRSQDCVKIGDEKALSYFSFSSVLEEFSLADMKTRGPFGVQSDLSIRGAPFEENLVLFNGVSLNDPQTGHHNMDLPFTLHDAERVDVTYGSASSTYGAGAMGGAVNILPRKPGKELGFFVTSATGSWDFYSGTASLDIPVGPIRNRSSVEWKRSTGYAPETEFSSLTASSYSEIDLANGSFDIFLGYLTKKFGAGSFYSDAYPNEEESLNTGLLVTKGRVEADGLAFIPVVYWKRTQDKFILDRNRIAFSRNDHTTSIFGGELGSEVKTGFGSVAFGAGAGGEDISSTSLGNHTRAKTSAFMEYENRISNFHVNAGARMDYYSTFDFEFSPSVNLGYEVLPGFEVKGGVARAFRVPSFTELYYSTPANRGNPGLKAEVSWSYEAGLNCKTEAISGQATVFLRNTYDIIDWTREGLSRVWEAKNIGRFDMCGLESSCDLALDKLLSRGPLRKLGIKYAYLDALDKKGITSKYVLQYLKHNLRLRLELELPFGVRQDAEFSFIKRIGYNKYFLVDSYFYRDVKLAKGKMTFFLKLENMFNTRYYGEGKIKMPGFAAFGGGSVEF